MRHDRIARVERLLREVLLEARRLKRAIDAAAAARPQRRRWTPEDVRVVRDRYPHEPTSAIARDLGRPFYTVYRTAARLGLRKTAEYLASPAACRLRRGDPVGAPYRFRKGHVPANKGLRRPGYAPGRMAQTQFKKGQRPHTWVPIGTEVVDRDGYRKRKVSDNRKLESRFNWRYVHVLVWERAHRRRVPPGHAIAFRNGNKADLRLANLELVSRRAVMLRNSVHQLPKALADVIQLRGALVRRIREATA